MPVERIQQFELPLAELKSSHNNKTSLVCREFDKQAVKPEPRSRCDRISESSPVIQMAP